MVKFGGLASTFLPYQQRRFTQRCENFFQVGTRHGGKNVINFRIGYASTWHEREKKKSAFFANFEREIVAARKLFKLLLLAFNPR